MASPPGSRLGPFEILAALGAGGMGEVYRARDTRLGRTVAIKVLLAKLKSLTNLRAVRDAKAAGGWRIETGPFPGWENLPTWQP